MVWSISKYVSVSKLPMLLGMVPDSPVWLSERERRVLRLPIAGSMLPVMPVLPRRMRVCKLLRLSNQAQGKLPLIGVGGIFTAEDAWEKICAGASLVQIYTGMVYEGPGVAKAVVKGLKEKVAAHGLKNIAEAVGSKK